MRSRFSLTWIGVLTASLILPIGCRKPEIQVYDTAKDTNAAARPLAQSPAPAPAPPPVTWVPAPGWQELPPTEFRKGNYLYSDDTGSAEITVTAFPGSTGGVLANANRWLRQASLPEIGDTKLKEVATEVKLSATQKATVLDLKADSPAPDSTRIFAAIIPFQGQTWFLKMTGPHATVETQTAAFRKMLRGMKFGADETPSTPTTNTPHLGELTFTAPDGWEESEGSSMRIASYTITKEGLPPADFSIISFPGDTGGTLANVNRWRRQIGLSDWTESKVSQAARTLTNPAGHSFKVFDLKSENDKERTENDERIIAAIMDFGGRSWFFKLRGDALLIDLQAKEFDRLLQSVYFSHEGHNH